MTKLKDNPHLPEFRGFFGEHGDSQAWLDATKDFPNGVPRFESKDECHQLPKIDLQTFRGHLLRTGRELADWRFRRLLSTKTWTRTGIQSSNLLVICLQKPVSESLREAGMMVKLQQLSSEGLPLVVVPKSKTINA